MPLPQWSSAPVELGSSFNPHLCMILVCSVSEVNQLVAHLALTELMVQLLCRGGSIWWHSFADISLAFVLLTVTTSADSHDQLQASGQKTLISSLSVACIGQNVEIGSMWKNGYLFSSVVEAVLGWNELYGDKRYWYQLNFILTILSELSYDCNWSIEVPFRRLQGLKR